MGMFDTVYANCPKCPNELSWQSKVGDCVLDSFEIRSVPMDIANSINGKIVECENCGTRVKIETNLDLPLRIAMRLEIIED